MVCGELLTYAETVGEFECSYCGKTDKGHISCPRGHFICDTCHNRDAMKVIEDIIFSTKSVNPFEIAELAMSFPSLPMLGCQHAFVAGGALMAAVKNEESRGITNKDIREVFDRTGKQAHGGYCGLSGVCGIAPAVGAVFSVLTGSKCGTDEEQHITMEAVVRVSRAIASLAGPSCCKAYVRAALDEGVEYLRESLGVELPRGVRLNCTYIEKHPHGCPGEQCRYFEAENFPKSPGGGSASTERSQAESTSDPKVTSGFDAKLTGLSKMALNFGAEAAKIIDPGTVVVEEWVRWKCQYGCRLFCKDAYHPPAAPDAESTRKVLGEYRTAILLKGAGGKGMTDAALKLEKEAYLQGYYKAFALTSLPSGPGGT